MRSTRQYFARGPAVTGAIVRDVFQDLRYASRSFRRSPGFAAIVVLTLALGIGANGAIFSLVNALFFRELPVQDPGTLLLLSQGLASGTRGEPSSRVDLYSYPLYQRLLADNQGDARVFDGLAAEQSGQTRAVVEWNGEGRAVVAEVAAGRAVSANYFAVLGVSAYRGRTFLPEDETTPGADAVAVISHDYWQRRFGNDPAVLGARVTINARSYTVVGIAAPRFVGSRIGERTDVWVPITMLGALARDKPILHDVGVWWVYVVGRLRPGVAHATAESSANLTLQRFLAEHPALAATVARRTGAVHITVASGATGLSELRPMFREPLLALSAGVGLLLLIVCLNLTHLLLARAVHRQREIGIRTALGASRGRLVRQLLIEALLLSALGAAVGAVVMSWLVDGLLALLPAGEALEVGADVRVAVFMGGLALGTACLLGIVPAWQATRADVQRALRTSALSPSGAGRLFSRALLISQVALSLVLLVGAGLLEGSLSKLRHMNKGFDDQGLLLVQIVPREMGLGREQAVRLYDDILARVTAVPGVRSASLSYSGGRVLSLRGRAGGVTVAGKDSSIGGGVMGAVVTPGYFDTVRMPMLRGRSFTRDDHKDAPPVVIVNEKLASRLFGDADQALGKRLRYTLSSLPGDLTVVGVVKDAKTMALREPITFTLYQPVAQSPDFLNSLEVSVGGNPASMAEAVRTAVRAAHPQLPITSVRTVSEQLDRALGPERIMAALSSAFGLAALFLVCVGLYGVISQWAAQRTREIGVRMALGATGVGVRWLVLRQAFVLVLVGAGLGLPTALGAGRLLSGLLHGVAPADPGTLTLATIALFTVGAVAAYLPARRASRVDPMVALRSE